METGTSITWPVLPGAYQVGDPQAPVAVCALTSLDLTTPLARLPGVAIAGNVYTANHGIERILLNLIGNPAIRFLLLCGKDAALFQPAQSLVALGERGIDSERRIVGAPGYEPVLPTALPEQVARFRAQVEIVDWTGEEDLNALAQRVRDLAARSPGRFVGADTSIAQQVREPLFISIRPGGQREPLQYDPKGYFVLTLDREVDQIVMRHYLSDHTPAHEMRGRSAGPMLLGLLREGLVSQLSHAGYLGEELAKAQAALQTGWRYTQDRPLRAPEEGASAGVEQTQRAKEDQAPQGAAPAGQTGSMPPRMPPVGPAMTWPQFEASAPGSTADVVVRVSTLAAQDRLVGAFLDPDPTDSFSTFMPTQHQVEVHWSAQTRIVMGEASDVQVGALLRVRGALGEGRVIEAATLVILSRVARVQEAE